MGSSKKKNRKKKTASEEEQAKKDAAQTEPEVTESDQAMEAPEEASEPVLSKEQELQQQLDELQDRYQRLGAEYINFQKRSRKLTEQTGETARENVIRALLPVIDNFDHTLEQAAENMDITVIMQGVQIVHDHLLNVLKGLGMQAVAVAPGCEFDPNKHEAMCHEASEDVEANAVLRELARGYMFNERTLRPAKVAIAKAPCVENDTADEAEDADRNSQECEEDS